MSMPGLFVAPPCILVLDCMAVLGSLHSAPASLRARVPLWWTLSSYRADGWLKDLLQGSQRRAWRSCPARDVCGSPARWLQTALWPGKHLWRGSQKRRRPPGLQESLAGFCSSLSRSREGRGDVKPPRSICEVPVACLKACTKVCWLQKACSLYQRLAELCRSQPDALWTRL